MKHVGRHIPFSGTSYFYENFNISHLDLTVHFKNKFTYIDSLFLIAFQ